MNKNFYNLFGNGKIVLGMIHLAGKNSDEKLERALEEIKIYEDVGLDGAIVEDYHGSLIDVEETLKVLYKNNSIKIKIGINTLKNPYLSFELADRYGADFVQFDTIQASAGDENNPKRFNEKLYNSLREKYPHICVFGGVRFKYIPPTGKTLEEDILDGISKCDAIVTTGSGTGIETPIEKLRDFRKIMKDFPLIVGAGVNNRNAVEQIKITNGIIAGSYFKNYNTEAEVEREYVQKLVDLIRNKFEH